MKVFRKILKVMGITIGIFTVFIGLLAVYNQIALKTEADDIIPNGQMIDLGDYRVHVYSEGENENAPTLVFLSGSATVAPVYDFKALYSLLSDEYRIAVVEKAGYGYSDIAEVDRDVATMINEVRSALSGAGIEAPYVLLPHSMSGLEAIYWAQNYPDEISGIIGIDMSVPEAYDDRDFVLGKTKLMKTFGKMSVDLGFMRIPGTYPLNEAPLSDEEIVELDEEFQDALRYISQAYEPAAIDDAMIHVTEGQWIYIHCSDNSFTTSEPSDSEISWSIYRDYA